MSDPIERYLDQLLIELRGRATDVRRILAETEEHLSDAVAEAMAEGLTVSQAEDRAIARFGSPRLVARRFGPATGPVFPELARAMVLLAAVGLIAIGASGALAMGLRAAFSATVGATVFGVAGGLLVVQGLAMLREGGDRGPGQWLSGGGVALIVAAYYGWTLLQSLRVRATIVR